MDDYSPPQPKLSFRSHQKDELQQLALKFFDKGACKWTDKQLEAARELVYFFDQSHVRADFEQVSQEHLKHLVRFSELCFPNGLRGTQVEWINDDTAAQLLEHRKYALGVTSRVINSTDMRIRLNAGHQVLRTTAAHIKWPIYRDVLIHELFHAFVSKYMRSDLKDGCGHGSLWQILAEAVECRLEADLGWANLDLERATSLVQEHKASKSTGLCLSQDDLLRCFGSGFVYNQSNNKLVSMLDIPRLWPKDYEAYVDTSWMREDGGRYLQLAEQRELWRNGMHP
ncbi:hypothetical protein LTR37_006436 [Vermiconidia calcicola]|uniref:Uncharacterized protein n=1 Tax=Vermiconidia calcicola TaxID=1690605 RepID=A0ACC3NH14_9PEZI|nr:hypothetical protein LTR37_006436 [Vermiconidia calcicola]